MDAKPIRQRRIAKFTTGLCVAIAAATHTNLASAGCGQPGTLNAPTPSDTGNRPEAAGFLDALYRPGAELLRRVVDDRGALDAGIVGTWRFTFVSDGTAHPIPIPLGAIVDFGTTQWHSDGTEFMISGSRPPSSGDVCMGSWQQTGPSTYKLKHIALAWASSDSTPPASPATYLGPGIIRETVTLNRARDTYEGTFTIDQYGKDEVTLLVHIAGKVIATRFSAQ